MSDLDNNSPDVKSSDLYECRRNFGLRLKSLREKQGFTLADVCEKTRVNTDFIAAIEAGVFERLPGRLFARGFLAAVLKLYNYTDDAIVSEFDSLWLDDGIREAISQSTKMRLAGKKKSLFGSGHSAGNILRLTSAALALVVICAALAGAAWFGYGKGKSYLARLNKGKAESSPTSLQLRPSENRSESLGAIPSESLETKEDMDDVQSAAAQTEAGLQVITISVVEAVKIKIESDSQKAVTKDYDVGTYKFTFKNASDLLIYDAGAVRISFNGNSIGPVGAKGRVRKIGFRASGPEKGVF